MSFHAEVVLFQYTCKQTVIQDLEFDLTVFETGFFYRLHKVEVIIYIDFIKKIKNY